MENFDLCVIGAGPAGYAVAMRGIDLGQRVLLVERDRVGGTGIYNGALTSKTMWEIAQRVSSANALMRTRGREPFRLDWSEVMKAVQEAAFERKYLYACHVQLLASHGSSGRFHHERGDAKTDVYVGDVGPDAGGDREERGPRGYDTVNQLRGPGNYGWPYSRGNRVYIDYDFAAKVPGAVYDKAKPSNKSPNNTGLAELPPVQAPFVFSPGGESEEFPILGKGGRTCGGPVFHYDPAFEEDGGLPEYFDGMVLFYDWQRPFIHWAAPR